MSLSHNNCISCTTSDAPALSTDQPTTEQTKATIEEPSPSSTTWDDVAVSSPAVVVPRGAHNVEDLRDLNLENDTDDDIAEKLKVEETKAQLAAAREGMEAAAREEKEQQKEQPVVAARWQSRVMRTQKLDTTNEELFPDLKSADEILKQQDKKNKPKAATQRKPLTLKPKVVPPKPVESPVESQPPVTPQETATASAPAAVSPVKPKLPIKKKKKKDLSTFKTKAAAS